MCFMGGFLAMFALNPDPPMGLPVASRPLDRGIPLVDSMVLHARFAYCVDPVEPLATEETEGGHEPREKYKTYNTYNTYKTYKTYNSIDGQISPRVVTRGDSRAVISFDQSLQRVVVSFRGTSEKLSWVRNFDIVTTPPWNEDPHIQVHAGFWASYEQIGPALREEISAVVAETGSCRLVSTGHSLGGAMSVLFVSDIIRRPLLHPACEGGMSIDAVVTFGSPRPGNRAFAEWYNRNLVPTWTISHSTDVIPRLPVRVPSLTKASEEWSHVGTLHAFSNSSCLHYVRVCPPGDSSCEETTLRGDASETLSSAMSTPSQHVVYFGSKLTRSGCSLERSWGYRVVAALEWVLLCVVILIRVVLHVVA